MLKKTGTNIRAGLGRARLRGVNLPLLCLLSALLLSACSSSVSRENFDRIKNNMSQDEVIQILGEPDKINSIELGELSGSTAQWVNKKHQITVTFAGGKVAFRTYGNRRNDD